MIAALLAIVTLYGVYSTPGLIRHWGGADLAALALLGLWLGAAALAIPLFARRPGRRMWLVLLAVTAAVRIGIAIPCLDRIPGGDALFYPLLAYSLSAGHGLQVHEPFMAETVRALYPPLYPIVLAAWNGAFGLATGALCALNLLIDGVAALLIARLGQRLGRAGAGRAAAWLYLIWPSVLLSSPVAQKEGLIALLVLALIHSWLRDRVDRGDDRAAGADPAGVAALVGDPRRGLAVADPDRAGAGGERRRHRRGAGDDAVVGAQLADLP